MAEDELRSSDIETSDKQLLMPSTCGWYGPSIPGSKVHVMDGSRPRLLERKPLLVGERSPRLGDEPHGPLSTDAAWVLCAILGITYETFLCLFDRVNLLKHWTQESQPRMPTLRVMTGSVRLSGIPVVFLGSRVAEAFGRLKENNGKFYVWSNLLWEDEIRPVVTIPHPDDQNPTYNETNERLWVREILERALLYHGKIFRIGSWPNGNGSLVMVDGEAWGDAARRLKHKSGKGK